ncbi:AraC family transcriptional regulator [Tenacibaculum aiptasiae]|uniref:AraC family transcriptional regulator n=1 Tax=Tenacibaculum aiptasiae TaxID=426481 RepID=A0A7J5AN17_9FLAO|nr:helix-turn-helix domain-containing protein [Tenacibaculum aiptasiae]KAB1158999.1 AraC family transcriptional regulator [Tenacibaculum aiptasiae]
MEQVTFELNLVSIIDILSIATALMLGFLLITLKSKNKYANIFLGAFLWSLGIEVLESFLESLTFETIHIQVIQTTLATIPLLLLYVYSTLNVKFKTVYLLLFIPFVISNLIDFPEEEIKWFEYVFNLILLYIILKNIKEHQNKVTDYYSDIENKTLLWIRTIVYIFLFFHVFWILEDIIGFQNEIITQYFAFSSAILTFFMIYWIAYNGFSQQEIFTTSLFQIDEKKETQIDVIDTENQFKLMLEIMEREKLYLDGNLNLRLLSEKVNIKERQLSKLIKTHTKKNFYHFVNQFRVQEFKKLVASPKAAQLSLLGLAQEAGFSSKSTFYTAFKNLEGVTPKQYQESLKKSE